MTESAELFERTSGISREIDILAELQAYGTTIRVAVEVRGRSKKDDVQWIDGLIGKYRDLPVNKLIAVSASGFSEGARAKAHSTNIELLAAKDVPHHDWPGLFHRLGLAMVTRTDQVDVQFITEPRGCSDFGPESELHDAGGARLGSVAELVDTLSSRHRGWLADELKANFLVHYKVVADLHKTLVIEVPSRPAAPTFIRTRGGASVQLAECILRSFSRPTVEKVPFKHVQVDSHLVSTAEVARLDGSHVEVFAIQTPARPNQVTIKLRPSPRRTARTATERRGSTSAGNKRSPRAKKSTGKR